MYSNICFENVFVVEAIRGRCASFMILMATLWELFGGQANSSILVLSKVLHLAIIYTIILHKSVCLSVCRRSQTAGRNSCSIVSGDVSN